MRKTIACQIVLGLFLPAGAAAQELDLPARQPGQWELSMTSDAGGPSMTAVLCLDEATDKDMMKLGMSLSEEMCTTQNLARDNDTVTIDATCTMGGMKTVSHTVMTGDFQTTYNVTTSSTIEGGPPGTPAETTMRQVAVWTGACADGMEPGDMLMPGGMKMNLRDAMGMMGGGG